MGIVVVQLSDLHFSENAEDNPVVGRVEKLCGAIRSVLLRSDHCALVFSGDIARGGKRSEYEGAAEFVKCLHDSLSEHLQTSPQFVIVPGNHDLDFDMEDFDESIRDLILTSLQPKSPPEAGMYDYCFKPLGHYQEFADKMSEDYQAVSPSKPVDFVEWDAGSTSVKLHLYNTSGFSRKTERPGTLWFPTPDSAPDPLSTEEPSTVTIGVLHHPYSWFRPDNARELRRLLESQCDIILTGHEHEPDQFQKVKRSTEQNLYVEGGVLQDWSDQENSSFNVIQIDTDKKLFLCSTFAWTGIEYQPLKELSEHRYIRLRQSLITGFGINEGWLSWLEQVGTDFRHPRCANLKLSDIFIYPDLQRLDIRKACSPTGIVRDRDVLGFIQEKKRMLIAGAEKTGKTSFAKRLFRDLRDAGYVPLLVRSGFRVGKGDSTTAGNRIRSALDTTCKQIYTTASAARFWQTKISERVLIVDDFDGLHFGDGGRDKLLQWFDKNFGIVVVFSGPGIRVAEVLNRTAEDVLLWTFEHVDILECDAESRYELIRKWLLAGADPLEVADDHIYTEAVRYGQVIDSIIGQGAIPSLPMFILMMMQQLETRGSVENATGLYGSLYELIIRDVIKSAGGDYADLEVRLNYLSEFAFSLHSRGRRFLEESDFRAWHAEYCDAYNCRLNDEQMVLQFEAIGVFRKHGESIGFKYRYYFCFFLARYLAGHIHENEVLDEVEALCSRLHNTDAANTMLFLCHLSKDPRILDLILASVKGFFEGADEYDLAKSPEILPPAPIRPARLALSDRSPEQERIATLRKRDEVSRPHGLDEVIDDGEATREEETWNLINEANSAYHAVRISGQLIRNFYGSMKGAVQVEVLRACYGLCLRMMAVLFNFLETDREKIAKALAEILHYRYPEMTEEELDKRTKRSLVIMALSICYGLIKHTSDSVGLSALRPSFDRLMAGGGVGISHRVLDLSTRLDYFDAFPERSALDLAEDLEKGGIGREVVRVLVWEHFKLFRRDYRVRQRVCAKLDIDASRAVLVDSKDKKLPRH